jgi:RNA polymerase-interacting CarD/CdnL/TRCF family regulator
LTQFKVGEPVVHLAHGIGRIAKLEHKQMFSAKARWYYEVAITKGTLWIPCGPEAEAVLRPVTSPGELKHYEPILKHKPAPLNENHRQRHLELTARLKQGSLHTLCEVVRDLTGRSWRKPLNESDSATLRRAYDSLCQEWALAAGQTVAEANTYINTLLAAAKQAHSVGAAQ